MKWNAFDFISPSFNKTKERLFPFNLKQWLKLFVLTLLSAPTHMSSYNFNSFRGYNLGGQSNTEIDIKTKLAEFIRSNLSFLGTILSFILVLDFIFTYLGSTFNFLLLDSLINKKASFEFRKYHPKGLSFFLLSYSISLILALFFLAILSPYIYYFYKGIPLIEIGLTYIIISVILFVAYFLTTYFLLLVLNDFVIPYMYINNTGALFSLKQVWKSVLNSKKEVFVYVIARLISEIAASIVGIIITIIAFFGIVLFAIIVFLIGGLINSLIGLDLLFLVLAAIFIILLIFLSIVIIALLNLPLMIFPYYLSYFNFEKLMNQRLFCSKPKEKNVKPWSKLKKVIVVGAVVLSILIIMGGFFAYSINYFVNHFDSSSLSDEKILIEAPIGGKRALTDNIILHGNVSVGIDDSRLLYDKLDISPSSRIKIKIKDVRFQNPEVFDFYELPENPPLVGIRFMATTDDYYKNRLGEEYDYFKGCSKALIQANDTIICNPGSNDKGFATIYQESESGFLYSRVYVEYEAETI